MLRKGKEELFKEIAASNYHQMYEMYIKSERYKGDTEKIKKREGQKFAVLYDFVAKNFAEYYLYGKAHIQKDKDTMNSEDNKNKKKVLFVVRKTNSNLFD